MDNTRLDPCIALPLDKNELEVVVEKAKDWALMHGACMRSKVSLNRDALQFAPFVLLPSTFPRREFDKAVQIQVLLNELMHKVAHNYDFLYNTLKRFVLQELGKETMLENLPENKALQGLCEGMLQAWKLYGSPRAVILFIVEDITYNICDQRFHQFEIRQQNPNVQVIRRTLTQMSAARLTNDKALLIDEHEVAVVYFRAGYEPGHYPGEAEWVARLLMEQSRAIKCPSIHYHLAGTKKVQQALARPQVLENVLGKSSDTLKAIMEIFTGLYSLEQDKFGEEAVQMALANPERFVLKPQREGGGNNVYGSQVRTALLSMQHSKERSAWILMDRITPPVQSNYLIRPGDPNNLKPQLSDVVSELGIFGVIIGDTNEILVNRQVGHMLRTKLSSADEGGVAAGLGALDSPYLVDIASCCSENKC